MAYIDIERRYIRFKVVYYGPQFSGKTTNIKHLHTMTKGKLEFEVLETERGSNVFYECMQLNLGKLRSTETILKLFTTPGRIGFEKTRQKVLGEADGIIFVADSQAEALEDNIASMTELEEHLALMEVELNQLPVVIQYNKRDLPGALPIEEIEERLNPRGWPWLASSAIDGRNVKKTLAISSQFIYQEAARRYSLIPSRIPSAKNSAVEQSRAMREEETLDEAIQESQLDQSSEPEHLERQDYTEDQETDLDDELAEGVAQHIINTVPPEDPLDMTHSSCMTTAPPAPLPMELTDLYRVISDFKEQLFTRLTSLDDNVQHIVEHQEKLDRDRREIHEILDNLTNNINGFENSMDTLKTTIESVIRTKVEGHLADYTNEK
ncbi:MAG: GTPase domain-containing protein [Proteobacteria bacterium]|nr:GTPase domain-containing protein [Pseudomonadota bacterium]